MTAPIVTRFAPSPTGYLHIGGARTALFNWLFARHHGGQFLLRIEDTDRARHNEQAVQAIIDGLDWLGITSDAPPVSQFEQQDHHVKIAHQLLEKGHAYRCYLTPEELTAQRESALANKARFESPWREKKTPPPDLPYAIRFKAPQTGQTIIKDGVQGDVAIPNTALDDMIILRSGEDNKSNGGPTYNLAVVVDDHMMGVTHIIRGDDHLINAARQQQIYEALDWDVPVFAHIPLIHGPDGKKLSKRHGALGVEAYRDMGYLPDGLVNYLLRLGWAHGDEEIIARDKAIELFDLGGINKSPARLDLEKLDHVNSHYIRALSDEDFINSAISFISENKEDRPTDIQASLLRGANFLKDRSPTLAATKQAAGFITAKRPLEITGKASKPLKKEGVNELLDEVLKALETHQDWSTPLALEALLQNMAEERSVGFGQIGQPVRAALTAGLPSPNLGDVLYALGANESIARIRDVVIK